MKILQYSLLVIGFLSACFTVALIVGYWIARGESDVNGDPERDAGLALDRARLRDYIEQRKHQVQQSLATAINYEQASAQDRDRGALGELHGLEIWITKRN